MFEDNTFLLPVHGAGWEVIWTDWVSTRVIASLGTYHTAHKQRQTKRPNSDFCPCCFLWDIPSPPAWLIHPLILSCFLPCCWPSARALSKFLTPPLEESDPSLIYVQSEIYLKLGFTASLPYNLCWNAVLILRILSDPYIVPNHCVSACDTKLAPPAIT